MKIKEVINYLDERFPKTLASDFDEGKIGLIVGDDQLNLKNILLTLDVNLEVVEDAIGKKCNLIICHHPFFFEPITTLLFKSERSKTIHLLLKNNISIYAMHTNYDVGKGGINDSLSYFLGLTNIKMLSSVPEKDQFIRYGRVKPTTLMELVNHVKKTFGLKGVRVSGNVSKTIENIGIVGGSGAHVEDINFALETKVDCYITSEIKLHMAQYAKEQDLCLIEINHGVEKLAFIRLKEDLMKKYSKEREVFLTDIDTDPFITI